VELDDGPGLDAELVELDGPGLDAATAAAT
jgi:hypothetical protein